MNRDNVRDAIAEALADSNFGMGYWVKLKDIAKADNLRGEAGRLAISQWRAQADILLQVVEADQREHDAKKVEAWWGPKSPLAAAIREDKAAEPEPTTILPCDPKPWLVTEDDSRYSMEEWRDSAASGQYGGPIYNLAQWKPRDGYEQDRYFYDGR